MALQLHFWQIVIIKFNTTERKLKTKTTFEYNACIPSKLYQI